MDSKTPKNAGFACLTIAGSDPSGGAGLQADLKTFSAHGVYGASAVTALTVQNSQGVQNIQPVPVTQTRAEIEAVLADLPVAAAKSGMLATEAHVSMLAQVWQTKNLPLVMDPVLRAGDGSNLSGTSLLALRDQLMPLATLITPNFDEALLLTGLNETRDEKGAKKLGEVLLKQGARAVLMKGGHFGSEFCDDWLHDGKAWQKFSAPRLGTRRVHGLGCALSAAICVRLAQGKSLAEAVSLAKTWLHERLEFSLKLNWGQGSLYFQAV